MLGTDPERAAVPKGATNGVLVINVNMGGGDDVLLSISLNEPLVVNGGPGTTP